MRLCNVYLYINIDVNINKQIIPIFFIPNPSTAGHPTFPSPIKTKDRLLINTSNM